MAESYVARFLAEIGRLERLSAPERELFARGFRRIAGVDEAGRGCLAGPVFAAAVILPPGFVWPGIDDSKRLDAAERDALALVIRDRALAVGVASVSARDIDATNIAKASLLAMKNALETLVVEPEIVLTDAFSIPGYLRPQVPMIHGDANSVSIAAASIVAKTARDATMDDLARKYPVFGFERHRGYGVEEHRRALAAFGPCPEHRLSFKGVVAEQRAS